tara:strand:- start:362 stop:679 length:318 start_codon:yes stop_codon:yes gene_type:complete
MSTKRFQYEWQLFWEEPDGEVDHSDTIEGFHPDDINDLLAKRCELSVRVWDHRNPYGGWEDARCHWNDGTLTIASHHEPAAFQLHGKKVLQRHHKELAAFMCNHR